jgi:hypothetical protein
VSNPNQILPFATGVGANVVPPTTYAQESYLQQGFQDGILDPNDLNTVLRQASFSSAMIAQFTADYGPNAVNDDGNLPNYEANFVAALHDLFVGIPDVLDLGTANSIVVNPEPPATSYAVPMELIIKPLFTNILVGGGTGATVINVSGLGIRPLIIPDGSQLLPGDIVAGGKILVSYEATSNSFMLLSQRGTAAKQNQIIHWGQDFSLTANQVVFTTDAAVTSYLTPTYFAVYVANNNTSTTGCTLNANGLGNVPITRGSSGALSVGDLVAGTVAWFAYDGTEAQLLNPQTWGNNTSGAPADWNDITGQLKPYWLTVNSASISATPSSPTAGDSYLLPPSPTGAWAGNGGKLAQWIGTAWVYRNYPAGSLVSASDTQTFYQNIGSATWQEVVVPTPGRLYFFGQL